MTRIERKPTRVAKWLENNGGDVHAIDPGRIQAHLEARGVVFPGPDGVSVKGDGTIVVEGTDATTQKLVANLDLLDPEALDPERARRAAAGAALRGALAEIRAQNPNARSPEGRALLALAVLHGLDDAPFEAAGR